MKKKIALPSLPPLPPPPDLVLPRFSPGWRFLLYPLAVLEPVAGVLLAALYLPQKDAAARRFGLVCAILAAVGFALRILTGWMAGDSDGGGSFLEPLN